MEKQPNRKYKTGNKQPICTRKRYLIVTAEESKILRLKTASVGMSEEQYTLLLGV
jgi:hypothetical protein